MALDGALFRMLATLNHLGVTLFGCGLVGLGAVIGARLAGAERIIAIDLAENRLQDALLSIWSLVTRANQYVDQTAPFKLAKDPAQAARLDQVLTGQGQGERQLLDRESVGDAVRGKRRADGVVDA